MTCDLDDLVVQLQRVADSLESIDTKTPELVALDDLIAVIRTGIGPGNLAVVAPLIDILAALSGLLPNIKVDATKLITDIFDRITFKGPVVGALWGINSLLTPIAAASVGSATAAYFKLLHDSFKTFLERMNQLKDMVIGDSWSLFGDIIYPMLDFFIPTDDGGTAEPGADDDPKKRISVRNNISIDSRLGDINVILDDPLNCILCGGSGCGSCAPGSAGSGFDDQSPYDQQIDPDPTDPNFPTGFDDKTQWLGYKCAVAQRFISDFEADLEWIQTQQVKTLTVTVLAGGASMLVPGGQILGALGMLSAMGQSSMLAAISELRQIVTDNTSTLLCDLYAGKDAIESRDNFIATIHLAIDNGSFVPGIDLLTKQLVSYWVSVAAVNELYVLSERHRLLTWDNAACAACVSPPALLVFDPMQKSDGWISSGAPPTGLDWYDFAGGMATSWNTVGQSHQIRILLGQTFTTAQQIKITMDQNHAGNKYEVEFRAWLNDAPNGGWSTLIPVFDAPQEFTWHPNVSFDQLNIRAHLVSTRDNEELLYLRLEISDV